MNRPLNNEGQECDQVMIRGGHSGRRVNEVNMADVLSIRTLSPPDRTYYTMIATLLSQKLQIPSL
jgi:hypothetical protein